MPESLSSFYQSRRDRFAENERRAAKEARFYATLRLITALAGLAAGWQAIIPGSHWLWTVLALTGLIIFIFLVRGHVLHRRRQRYFGRLKLINEREIQALGGQMDTFLGQQGTSARQQETSPGPQDAPLGGRPYAEGRSYADGSPYADPAHPYTYDLDIFGDNSVFQLVNRTACLSGEALLVKTLNNIPENEDVIRQRQQAIAELAPLVDFRQHFMAKGQGFKESTLETQQLYEWLKGPASPFNTPFLRILRYFLPSAALLLLGLALTGVLPHTWWVLAFLFNLAFTGLFLKRINRVHVILGRKHLLLEKLSRLLEHTGKQEFNDVTLQSLRRGGLEAFEAIHRLTKLLSFFDQRMNFMVGAVLNGFFLSDIHCVVSIDRWRARYREQMPHWLDSIFRMDELNSFANFAFNHPDYCYAEFHDRPFIAAEQLGHPLIAGRQCIPNDFAARETEKVVILTGANMSGKSTFLRSLGVNLVLAYAGAPVFARKFSCCLAGIYSSMRVSDSLGEDTSYFYAELKRLSSIMEQLRARKRLFILLDEILKGTNSADKLYGSTGLVEEFIRHDCLCVIATHDLDLGKMEEKHPGQVSNYCFESTLDGNELHFDYSLRKGIARNKNATFLMKKTGLIK